MEQRPLKMLTIVWIPSLETSGGQSSNLYLNAVHSFNASVN